MKNVSHRTISMRFVWLFVCVCMHWAGFCHPISIRWNPIFKTIFKTIFYTGNNQPPIKTQVLLWFFYAIDTNWQLDFVKNEHHFNWANIFIKFRRIFNNSRNCLWNKKKWFQKTTLISDVRMPISISFHGLFVEFLKSVEFSTISIPSGWKRFFSKVCISIRIFLFSCRLKYQHTHCNRLLKTF